MSMEDRCNYMCIFLSPFSFILFSSFLFYTIKSTRTFCEYRIRITHIVSVGLEMSSSGISVVILILYKAGNLKDHSLQRVR